MSKDDSGLMTITLPKHVYSSDGSCYTLPDNPTVQFNVVGVGSYVVQFMNV